MLHSHPNLRRPGTFLVALVLGSVAFTACTDLGDDAPTAPEVREQGADGPSLAEVALTQDFGPALAASRQHTPALMSIPGVVGVGVGLNDAGRAAVKIFLAHGQVEGLPSSLGDVPVAAEVTGLFRARADPTSRARPAPIGFSVGHPDVTAGTLGARVTGGGNVYILSNNHVIANSNNASEGDATLQPGSVDGGSDPDDVIGTLHDFQEIHFDGTDNEMDAAISLVDGSDVSGSTPADEGYGAPGTTVTEANIGLAVQKYGRTTKHTQGEVSEIDLTVTVCYAGFIFCTQSATFVNQIGITPGGFSDGGDSGSLIVTDDTGANPVGLLFAGSSNRTIANPIGPVLDRFNVQIDPTVPGDGGGGDTNDPPTASFTSTCTDLTCDFDGSGSSDPDGSIVSYDWDFDDNATDSGVEVTHTFSADGTYQVTLTVTDDDGATDSQQQDVTVSSGGDGGDTPPSVDVFQVSTRTTGPWQRADVTWEVSDADGDLASVTLELLDSGGSALDTQTTSVSGGSASGQTELRTRSGTPTDVRITVTDSNGNETIETQGI